MTGFRLLPLFLAVAVAGCAEREVRDPVQQVTEDLTEQQDVPVRLDSMEEVVADGDRVTCGIYSARARADGKPALMGFYVSVNGRLLDDPLAARGSLIDACRAKLPLQRPQHD